MIVSYFLVLMLLKQFSFSYLYTYLTLNPLETSDEPSQETFNGILALR